jgi:hypothetical protein
MSPSSQLVEPPQGHRAAEIGVPYVGDPWHGYANPAYDALWATFVDLDMPVCAHIGSSSQTTPRFRGPGSTLRDFMDTFLDSANTVGLLIAAGIFERFPKLRLVVPCHGYFSGRHVSAVGYVTRQPIESRRPSDTGIPIDTSRPIAREIVVRSNITRARFRVVRLNPSTLLRSHFPNTRMS